MLPAEESQLYSLLSSPCRNTAVGKRGLSPPAKKNMIVEVRQSNNYVKTVFIFQATTFDFQKMGFSVLNPWQPQN